MKTIGAKIATALALRNEKGVTAIEYGMLAALISLAIIGAVIIVGGNLNDVFTSIGDQVHG